MGMEGGCLCGCVFVLLLFLLLLCVCVCVYVCVCAGLCLDAFTLSELVRESVCVLCQYPAINLL